MTALLTVAQRARLALAAHATDNQDSYTTIDIGMLSAALATIDALEASITTAITEAARLRAALNRQAPLLAAATALADCHAWIDGATTEAEDDQACGAFDVAADLVTRQVATLRGATPPALPATSLPALLAAAGYPAAGAWLLNEAGVIVEYTHGDSADGGELRRLDLVEAGRVLIIGLAEPDDALPAGLATLVPVAGHCRVCGCSQFNACVGPEGPCSWAASDLCSACAGGAQR